MREMPQVWFTSSSSVFDARRADLTLFIGARSNVSTKVPTQRARLALQVAGTANTHPLAQRLLQNGPRLLRNRRRARVRSELERLKILEEETALGLRIRWSPRYYRRKSGMRSMISSNCISLRKCRFFIHQPSEFECVKLRTQEIFRCHQWINRMGKFYY